MQRHGHAAQASDLLRPLAGAIDHDFGFDVAAAGRNAGDCAILAMDRGDARLLENARAAHARALGQRLRDIGRIDLAVERQPQRAGKIVGAHDRIFVRRLLDGDQRAIDPLRFCRGCDALEQGDALGRARHQHRAALLPAGGLSGFLLELRIKLRRILHQPRHVLVRAQLADKTGRVPGGAAGEPSLLEQDHVAPAELGEMIGDRATHHAAADDDGAGLIGKSGFGHDGFRNPISVSQGARIAVPRADIDRGA